MNYASEWDGFVTQSYGGIAEALDAAGVDCGLHSYGHSHDEPANGGDPGDEALCQTQSVLDEQ